MLPKLDAARAEHSCQTERRLARSDAVKMKLQNYLETFQDDRTKTPEAGMTSLSGTTAAGNLSNRVPSSELGIVEFRVPNQRRERSPSV